ncbi:MULTISPECIES: host attachment family protein [unclassified Rhizobium]|uniref:baeRF12 domain-containing protein n=1 Tax=unclassified Rhizobium TaxID=2613769 RepID=UPI0010E3C5A3|nr:MULTISPECIES: host attachment family protein [unclassified Rhizobium]MBB3394176.1 protein required for attachment to host cells [Rhizobium sp. BK060]MBB4171935.1 protein required for attachment to host cells [Rhizobium sp. BK538]TCM63345.1 protein required for attachment to host cells [Rhizobium sp. BK068]
MDKIRIRSKDWILVCDGSKALFLRNDGDAQDLNLVEVRTLINEGVPTHELGADRPGKVHASADGVRSAVEAPDLHERQEEEFLANAAGETEADIRRGATQRLLLIAPPRALGFLRQHLGTATQAALVAEIAKDYTKMPVREIEARLQEEVR